MTIAGIEGGLFRRVLRRHAAAVVVVTAPRDGGGAGFTATSFTSVSLEPPLVSFCVAKAGSARPSVRSGRCRRARADRRAGEGRPDLRDARYRPVRGLLRRRDLARRARLACRFSTTPSPCSTCRVVNQVEAGDHVIVIAAPVHAEHHDDASATPPCTTTAGTRDSRSSRPTGADVRCRRPGRCPGARASPPGRRPGGRSAGVRLDRGAWSRSNHAPAGSAVARSEASPGALPLKWVVSSSTRRIVAARRTITHSLPGSRRRAVSQLCSSGGPGPAAGGCPASRRTCHCTPRPRRPAPSRPG